MPSEPSKWLSMFREHTSDDPRFRPCADSPNSPDSFRCSGVGAITTIEGRPIEAREAIGTRVAKEKPEAAAPKLQVEDWRDLYEERASIREFDGHYIRAEAERLAWAELQNRWHMERGERVPPDLCAGCRRPIGDAAALDLIDRCRVHFKNSDCLIRHGERWRVAATRALLALGLRPPSPNELNEE